MSGLWVWAAAADPIPDRTSRPHGTLDSWLDCRCDVRRGGGAHSLVPQDRRVKDTTVLSLALEPARQS